MLDEIHMKELFRQQRDALRLNRERIKKVREGSQDPDLVPLPSPQGARKPKSVPRVLPPQGTDEALDFSHALTKKSARDFLRSRSAVLEGLETEGSSGDEGGLDRILERAKALNDALDITDPADAEEPEGDAQCAEFFLPDRVLNFPVVRNTDSLAYRAEAIRAFLEREIGLDRLRTLWQADGDAEVILRDCEAGVAVLAQQLLVLEETIDAS
jgi:hypothetical protein